MTTVIIEESLASQIKGLITETFFLDEDEIEDTESLIDQGVLTSQNILELVALIEQHFDLEIDVNEVSIDNFVSIDKIGAYLKKKNVFY